MSVVMITGARAPIALEMARSFAAAGHSVILADSLHYTIGRWSNAVTKYYHLPSPRFQQEEFIAKLKFIIAHEGVKHLIPTCEEAFYISFHQEKFNCKVWTSSENLMHNLHHKYLFSQFGQNYFPIPETSLVTNFRDWENAEQYVFKPVFSRFATSTIIRKKLSETAFKGIDKSKWVAQKYISGKEICVYSIWDGGVMKAYAAYHPLYRAGKGSGIFFEPDQHAITFELISAFGTQVKYTGQLSFDVIIDSQNIPYFIECNPRGISGAHLINKDLANAFLTNEIFIFRKNQEYAIKYALAILKPASFFKKRVRKSRDVIYKARDKKPFLMQILSLFEITFIKFVKRLSWLEATTGDIEWNGYE